jgi:hypothetical protein
VDDVNDKILKLELLNFLSDRSTSSMNVHMFHLFNIFYSLDKHLLIAYCVNTLLSSENYTDLNKSQAVHLRS